MYLNCHSYYSLKYGTISPEELVALAVTNGITQLCLTDINNTSAHMEFIKRCELEGIKPSVGVDFRNGTEQCFATIAKNNQGYEEVNRYLSGFLHEKKDIPPIAPSFENVQVIYPYGKQPKELRENEFIGVSLKDIASVAFKKQYDKRSKYVFLQTATFRNKTDFNIHRLLRAIDNNCLLSKLPESEQGLPSDLYYKPNELAEKLMDFPEIIERTNELLESNEIKFTFGATQKTKNLSTYTGSVEKDNELLHKLAYKGISYRYPNPTKAIYDRIEKELDIIRQKDFVTYFLINWDIVMYARQKKYFYVGRGSGANSIIAYLLRITDVDPIELDLYFERFINLYRQNPPDFDMDFSWRDRDDVVDYIFSRFDNVTLQGSYNTFQSKAVVRELGKVFGLPKHEIDAVTRGKKGSQSYDHLFKLINQYSPKIKDFPSHLSVHASGILITDNPIYHYSATSLPPYGKPVTHFDMLISEDIGIYKFDILSQRGLGKIKDALKIIRQLHPEDPEIDIHNMNMLKEDEKVKYLLRNAKTMGCFYVESPAMRMLLTKLRAETYLGLVAASSIIRPGVAKSGMMREYVLRFRNPHLRKERGHPILLDIMEETYGIMVYQEDVIKVAHYFANLTLEEADHLRRGMSGKYRSREEFQITKRKYFENCARKGISKKDTDDVWNQIESFAGYAFSKGHSASYAVESYQSLYLKAHYPLEFMVSVINNFGGFYRTEIYLHEARMNGATIEPPCINRSQAEATLEGTTILLGFIFLTDLNEEHIEEIISERNRLGEYKSLRNFILRANIPLNQLKTLIKADTFRFTGKTSKELFWELHMYMQEVENADKKTPMFEEKPDVTLPKLNVSELETAFQQIEVFGFYLTNPFNMIYSIPINVIYATELQTNLGKEVNMVGYLVAKKYVESAKGVMYFGTFLDLQGNFFDTVIFPDTAEKYAFEGIGVYMIHGKVVEEYDFFSLETISMERLAVKNPEVTPA
ncbi:MAG: DNA polymerase III subunit alpha [Cyclobacteriaceae bacterium]|nr:DNA polymerase III subunit alpha [Cyclobacteriaceae bacterium]